MIMSFAMTLVLKQRRVIHILRIFGGDVAPNQQERQ